MLGTVQPFGRRVFSRAIVGPGILDLGETAQSQPLFEALPQLARTAELDGIVGERGLEQEIAHEDACHGSQVGRDVQIDLEPRIGGAKIGLLAVADQPPRPFRRRQSGEFELHTAAAARKRLRLDAAAHVPHQHRDIELLAVEAGAEPALTPLAQLPDDGRELVAGLRQVVLRPLRTLPALDYADLLELLQAQTEQAPRHQRYAAMQIAELRAAAQQLSQQQRRPALAEDLGALGDRAELTIALHGNLLVQSPVRAGIRRPPAGAPQVQILYHEPGPDP